MSRELTDTSSSTVLSVEGLVKIYGKRRVVDGVSFHVRKGEIVGLLGPNGAGKTTSFRMACGLINTNGGIVCLGSKDVTNWPMYRRSREGGMGYLPQEKSVFQKLSVQNNLLAVMEMLGMKRPERKKRCDELLEKFNLTHLRRNYGGGLSGGERRRLEIARALVSNPKIILLDEPFAAVDPITVTGIQEIIRQLAQDGIAILITDHSVQDTLQITQRSYVIQAGQVLCHGTPEEVLSNPEARKVYFGENVSVEQIRPGFLPPISRNDRYSEPRRSEHHKEKEGHRNAYSPLPSEPKNLQERYSNSEWDSLPNITAVQGTERPAEQSAPPVLRRKPRTEYSVSAEDETVEIRKEERTEETPDSTLSSDARKRLLGKRLPYSSITMPERPAVHSAAPSASDSVPPSSLNEEPAAGMSGIIRSLRSLIGKK